MTPSTPATYCTDCGLKILNADGIITERRLCTHCNGESLLLERQEEHAPWDDATEDYLRITACPECQGLGFVDVPVCWACHLERDQVTGV